MASADEDLIGCMIVGMHKCGTTSLRDQLAEHPGIATHAQLECSFFSTRSTQYEPTGRAILQRYFPDADPGAMLVAKHATACCDEEELARIAAANPSCRVILTVRDPVSRALSAYMMESSFGARQAPFSEMVEGMLGGALAEDDWRTRIYLRWGCFDAHLDRIHRHFDPANVRVVAIESLRREPRETVTDLFDWLGLDRAEVTVIGPRNVGSKPRSLRFAKAINWVLRENNPMKPVIRRLIGPGAAARAGESLRSAAQLELDTKAELDVATRDRLRAYFAPSVDRLEAMVGRDFRAIWGWDPVDTSGLEAIGTSNVDSDLS